MRDQLFSTQIISSSAPVRPYVYVRSRLSPVAVDLFMTPLKTYFPINISGFWWLWQEGGAHSAVLHLPPHYSHSHSLEFSTLCNSQSYLEKIFHTLWGKKPRLSGCGWTMRRCTLEIWTRVRLVWLDLNWDLKANWGDLTWWPMQIEKCSAGCSCVYWSSANLSRIINNTTRMHVSIT